MFSVITGQSSECPAFSSVSLNDLLVYWSHLVILYFAENAGFHVFDFLANSILKEVLSAIQKEKPGAFSPGRPTEFLKNYKSSLDFLSHLEGMIL